MKKLVSCCNIKHIHSLGDYYCALQSWLNIHCSDASMRAFTLYIVSFSFRKFSVGDFCNALCKSYLLAAYTHIHDIYVDLNALLFTNNNPPVSAEHQCLFINNTRWEMNGR